MPLPRMTTRRWMVAVAVVGAADGRERSRLPSEATAGLLPGLRPISPGRLAYRSSEKVPHWVTILKTQIDLHERMRLENVAARLAREMAYHTRHGRQVRACRPLPLAPRRARPAGAVTTTNRTRPPAWPPTGTRP